MPIGNGKPLMISNWQFLEEISERDRIVSTQGSLEWHCGLRKWVISLYTVFNREGAAICQRILSRLIVGILM